MINAGLSPQQWRDALDRYLTEGTFDADLYTKMNSYQIGLIQEIKKSINRIKNKDE